MGEEKSGEQRSKQCNLRLRGSMREESTPVTRVKNCKNKTTQTDI